MKLIFSNQIKCFIFVLFTCFFSNAKADGLKVFGREFCSGYDAGACINIKNQIDAKSWSGQYKYPKGREAFLLCSKRVSGTDSDMAYCSMIFHREEQSLKKRAQMCSSEIRQKYWEIASQHAMEIYDSVWNCRR
jgi:hypothetical protein